MSAEPPARYSFRVYVTGESRRSVQTLTNLRSLCESRVPGEHSIELVDVLDQPVQADEHRILATPTVLRTAPGPVLRVIGDLSDHDAAAAALGLPPTGG